jgi:uncharacterized membrane protein
MIWIYVLGYAFVGIVTAGFIYQSVLKDEYNTHLHNLQKYGAIVNVGMHETALEKAKRSSTESLVVGWIFIGALLWPLVISIGSVVYVVIGMFKGIAKISSLTSSTERKVAKMRRDEDQRIEQEKARKVLLEDYKSKGIDTKQLEGLWK